MPKTSLFYFFRSFIAVSLYSFPCLLHAADIFEYGPFKIQRYIEADGLVSAETVGTYKDVHGFFWVATFGGLSRFDGRTVQNFGRQSGLRESNIDLIGEDSARQLFVKSVSAVYRYTGSCAKPFLQYPTTGRFVVAACPDGNGRVWVAYEG